MPVINGIYYAPGRPLPPRPRRRRRALPVLPVLPVPSPRPVRRQAVVATRLPPNIAMPIASTRLPRRRRNRRRRNSPRSQNANRINANLPSIIQAKERVATITVSPETVPGTLLLTLPANPTSAPRSGVIATQYDSWSGHCEMEVETTGNAFSKNYVALKHAPNGDPSRIPLGPDALLNFAEAGSRPLEATRLQLDSNQSSRVAAPWSLSYNPKKPIIDTDPSECNNGVFVIVANGTPGTETVTLTVRLSYRFMLYGPVYEKQVADTSASIFGDTPSLDAPFPPTARVFGTGIISHTDNTVTLKKGRYLSSYLVAGSGITAAPNITSSDSTITLTARSVEDTQILANYVINANASTTVDFPPIVATSLSQVTFTVAPFTA
uniref:Capsid protein n=1 Tax=Crocidura lasiura astrovirus TaxID=3139461 RepID=A0AB38ZJP7_9VIRU